MGADYLSYVKSIALTFFGYIILVLVSVTSDCVFHYIFAVSWHRNLTRIYTKQKRLNVCLVDYSVTLSTGFPISNRHFSIQQFLALLLL